ncbi:MAG: hypothetical protein WBA57_18020 [Elainellaceae cyanobacterium]
MKTASIQFTQRWHSALADYITALTWSGDGAWLAAASAVGEVLLHRLDQDSVSLQTANHQSINTLGFSADGQFLAAAGQAGDVTVWDVRSPSPSIVFTQSHHGIWIDQLAWHPQHPYLAYGVGSEAQIWDIATSVQLAQPDFQASSILHLTWHPHGTSLAASGHGGVRVWPSDDWSAEPQLVAVPGASLYAAWSSDGRYLGSGNLDRTLTVAEWGSPPPWLMQGFPGKVRQIAWSDQANTSSSPLLAAACVEGITVWQRQKAPQRGWQSTVLQQHQARVNAIAFQPGTQLLASAGQDGQLCLWQQGKKLLKTLKGDAAEFSSLVWHPTGQYLAAGGAAGKLTLWQQSIQSKGFGR